MDSVPLELNRREIRFRENTDSEMCVYGYLPMMVSAQCVQKNYERCSKKNAVWTIRDRYKKEFHVACNCEFCYNTIYNTLPMSLLREADEVKRLGIRQYRLNFTMEDAGRTEQIAREFAAVYVEGREPDPSLQLLQMETTRGHFGRGVE